MPTMHSDTRKLLTTGAAIFGAGVLCVLLMLTVFGGVSRSGPHNNGGWLALMIAMGCLPMGSLLLLLGGAKWIGDRRR